MRIAFDLDGVLADLHHAYVATALRLFPELDASAVASADVGASPAEEPEAETAASPTDVPGAPTVELPVSRRQSSAIWDSLCATTDFWEGLQEIEKGSVAQVAAIADARRWEVLFITSRPASAGATVQRQSQRWLQRMGFPLPSVYVVHGSRGRIADALKLDVVVDDRADNCLDVALESKARAVLVWRGEPGAFPGSAKRLGIGVVPTVARCLETLVEADRAEGAGDFRDRLRRLLGLRPKASTTSQG